MILGVQGASPPAGFKIKKACFMTKKERTEGNEGVEGFHHPPIVLDLMRAYKQWYGLHAHLPKLFRITISTNVLKELSSCIEQSVQINFSVKHAGTKQKLIEELLCLRGKIELLKSYVHISYEMKYISHGYYLNYMERIENISKQAASWQKWIEKQN